MIFFVDFLNRSLKDYKILNNIGSDIITILLILLSKLFFSNCIIIIITIITIMTINFNKYLKNNKVLLKNYTILQYIFVALLFDIKNSSFLQIEVFYLIIKRNKTVNILYSKLHFKSLFQLIHIQKNSSTTFITIILN